MAIEIPSVLVELAKVGVAGAVLFGLYTSGSLLKQRQEAMRTSRGYRDDKPLYAYMVLTLAVGALLIVSEVLPRPGGPSAKPDLSSEIKDLRLVGQGLEKLRRTADNAARSISFQMSCTGSSSAIDAQGIFKDIGGSFGSAQVDINVVAERLAAHSSQQPLPPIPLEPHVPISAPACIPPPPAPTKIDLSDVIKELRSIAIGMGNDADDAVKANTWMNGNPRNIEAATGAVVSINKHLKETLIVQLVAAQRKLEQRSTVLPP